MAAGRVFEDALTNMVRNSIQEDVKTRRDPVFHTSVTDLHHSMHQPAAPRFPGCGRLHPSQNYA